MLRATAVIRKAAVKPAEVVDAVTLDHEARQRRRFVVQSDVGADVLIDLEKPAALRDGDALRLQDGRLLLVKAAPEPLIEVRAESPLRLLRVAWHIGNRHTPAEITEDAIYLADDHVLATMVRGLGCAVRTVSRPFQPEPGAYAHAHSHEAPAGDTGAAHAHDPAAPS